MSHISGEPGNPYEPPGGRPGFGMFPDGNRPGEEEDAARWNDERRRARVRAGVSWLIILGVLGGIIALNAAASGAAGKTDQTDPKQVSTFALELLGRYALGAQHLVGSMGSPEAASATWARQIDATILNPVDKVRGAVLAAELVGVDEAIARLDSVIQDDALPEALRSDARSLKTIYLEGTGALAPGEPDHLRDRHDWIAELALAYGLPESDPARKAVLEPASRTFITAVAAIGIAGMALVAGLALGILAIVLLASGKLRFRFDRMATMSPLHRAALLEAFALFMAGLLLVQVVGQAAVATVGVDISSALIWLLPVLLLWPLARGMSKEQLRHALGWTRGAPDHRGRRPGVAAQVGQGLIGYLAGLPIAAVGVLVALVLVAISGAKPSHPTVEEAATAGFWNVLAIYMLACVWAPLVEESVFRGAFYQYLRGFAGPVISALVVAFFFAAAHPQGMAFVPALMGLAVVFALIREWTGSLIGCAAAHAVHNGFMITAILLMTA